MWAFFPYQLAIGLVLELVNSWTKLHRLLKNNSLWRMTKPKKQSFKDTKVSVSVFSADISKSEEISRWRTIDKTLHYDFSATETFFKNRHNFLSEGLTFFPAMGST